ncbi:MAG: CDP-archaeol synthase [Gammaproteobacteria bacterium]|nr:CDP-archaeol synthase [Gammaproteobacteria bacterium]
MNAALLLAAQLLTLLIVANGVPVLVTRLLGRRADWPLDGGLQAWDGRSLLGPSKTIRGLVASVLATAAVAALLGLGWPVGLLFGTASMIGDLCSSFLKRRLGIESSGQAVGLDQLPEALFPLLACYALLPLNALLVVVVVTLFALGQLLLSPLMYRLGIRRRPY